jgi:hypothetical protein
VSGVWYASAGHRCFAARCRPENGAGADTVREATSTAAAQAVEEPPPWWATCEDCESSGHPPSPHKPAASK